MKKVISFAVMLVLLVLLVLMLSVGCFAQERINQLQNIYKQLVLQEVELKAQLENVTRDKERTAGMIIEYNRAEQEMAEQEKAKEKPTASRD